MTEGASEPVEQAVAPAAAPVGEPVRLSLWERLKPVWWIRGVVSAVALVGLLDQLGLIREQWLRVFHAVGTRAREIIGWIADRISEILPWNLELMPQEGVVLAFYLAFLLPIAVGLINGQIKGREPSAPIIIGLICVGILLAFAIPFGPGDRDKNFGGFVWVFAAGFPAVVATASRPLAFVGWVCFLVLLILGAVVLERTFRVDLGGAPFLALLAFVGIALWITNKTFAKGVLITLSFLATLELFYLVPMIQQAMQPFIDWIDPAGAKP